MDAADLPVGQQIDLIDINNGNRLTTYAIEGERGSGVVGLNGASARLILPGDLVIIIAYALVPEDSARTHAAPRRLRRRPQPATGHRLGPGRVPADAAHRRTRPR